MPSRNPFDKVRQPASPLPHLFPPTPPPLPLQRAQARAAVSTASEQAASAGTPLRPLRVMISGAPASGKGTQCELIVHKVGLRAQGNECVISQERVRYFSLPSTFFPSFHPPALSPPRAPLYDSTRPRLSLAPFSRVRPPAPFPPAPLPLFLMPAPFPPCPLPPCPLLDPLSPLPASPCMLVRASSTV
ncbi:unnamed protein product [Closterium sp. Naga37s-1]|nr:unnamed protein product [Closterium sp. Naga37s-1]